MKPPPDYEGQWVLIPELSFYDRGTPPSSGTYRISVEDRLVSFSIDWVVEGEANSIAFEGPLDGRPHTLSVPPGAQAAHTHVDSQTLESRVSKAGEQIGFARRRVSNDRSVMAVLQINREPDGETVRVFQIYRRET